MRHVNICITEVIIAMLLMTGCNTDISKPGSTQIVSTSSQSGTSPTIDKIESIVTIASSEIAGSVSPQRSDDPYPAVTGFTESTIPTQQEGAYPQPEFLAQTTITEAYPIPSEPNATIPAVVTSSPRVSPLATKELQPLEVSPTTKATTTPGDMSSTPPPVVKAYLEATDPKKIKLTSGKEQLIEFFAFWDPTSKSMATVVHDLEIHYQDRIHFIYLDIDDPATSEFKKALGYKYPPHFFLVNGEGEVLQQWIGFVTKYEFEDAFALIP